MCPLSSTEILILGGFTEPTLTKRKAVNKDAVIFDTETLKSTRVIEKSDVV